MKNGHRDLWRIALVVTSLGMYSADAYETGTHARITEHAARRSDMYAGPTPNPEFFSRLGLDFALSPTGDLAANPFGPSYYDVAGNQVEPRTLFRYEQELMTTLPDNAHTVVEWLMNGSIREDDLGNWLWGRPFGDDPHDDPYGVFFRVFNHFYDPIVDRPLVTIRGEEGEKAPNWALGTYDAFVSSPLVKAERRNHFTIVDARESMYRAITGKTRTGADAGPGNTPSTQSVRRAYWATTLRALGDVLHLNQDMAQPQHTRNDAHSGFPGFGHKSIYEIYVECRATGRPSPEVRGFGTENCDPLSYDSEPPYPIPAFTRYSDYFSTRQGMNGRGLADYSNREFFTAGKNLGDNEYSSPPNDPGVYQLESVALADIDAGYVGLNGSMSMLTHGVRDAHTQEEVSGVPLTTRGLWYRPLAELTTPGNAESKGYTLTRRNYDAMASLLIPRAAAYSAGIINYFFRGRLDISIPPDGVFSMVDASASQQFERLRLTLRNVSTSGESMSGGYATAVVRFHRNSCYTPDLSNEYGLPDKSSCRSAEEEIVRSLPVALSLNHGAQTTITFNFTANPIPHAATDIELQVVYRGALGQEADALAVGAVNLSEPTYFDIINMTDYFLLNGKFYLIPTPFDASTLPSQVDPLLFGYIDADHNGQYEAGVDRNLARQALSYRLRIGGQLLAEVTLAPSSFARLVTLMKADASVQLSLEKLTYGYPVSIELYPSIIEEHPGWTYPAPVSTRGRYHYQTSPDHGFYPAIVQVPTGSPPTGLPPLDLGQATPVTLHFPAP